MAVAKTKAAVAKTNVAVAKTNVAETKAAVAKVAKTKVAETKKASGGGAMSGVIRARVDPALKARAEAILGRVGLNASDAIRLFYSQVALRRGLPFEVKVPNAATRKAIREADAGKGTAYAGAEEMFEKMGT